MFIQPKDNKPSLTPEQLKEVKKRFEWLTGFLICRFKFTHTILGMTNKVPIENFGTMGVRVLDTGKFELVYDPTWFYHLTDHEGVYIFAHETYHIALHHCTRRPLARIANINQPTAEEIYLRQLSQLAHDLAVNELIPVIPGICEMPRDSKGKIVGQFVSEYKKKKMYEDIEFRQTSEWYFEYLKKKHPIEESKGGNGAPGEGGNVGAPGEGGNVDDHSAWKEQDMADARVNTIIKKIEDRNLWGDMTYEQKELVKAAQIRKINWRNLIKVWFGLLAHKMRQTTRKRPNRRYGFLFPGTKQLYVDRWLVATDNSASVDEELLGQWLGVLNQLADEIPIDIVQFDTKIQSGPDPYDRRQTKFEFKGRGGTHFQPVINIVDKIRYKGVMILTDGEAGVPTRPKCTEVLWVLPMGHNPPVDWGKRVHLQKHV